MPRTIGGGNRGGSGGGTRGGTEDEVLGTGVASTLGTGFGTVLNNINQGIGGIIGGGGTGGTGGTGGSGGSGGGSGGYFAPQYQVPDMDFSIFGSLRDQAQASAGTARQSLRQSYENLLSGLKGQKRTGTEQFGQGRATVAENAYDRSRANVANLASRGLAGSGLEQLGNVQNRMETGRQVSNLASQYYDLLDKLSTKEKEGTQAFNTQEQQLENQLQAQLNNIGMQEWSAQNAYKQQLADANYRNQQAQAQAQARASSAKAQAQSGNANLAQGLEMMLQGFDAQTASLLTGADPITLGKTFGNYESAQTQKAKQGVLDTAKYYYGTGDEENAQNLIKQYQMSNTGNLIGQGDLSSIGLNVPEMKDRITGYERTFGNPVRQSDINQFYSDWGILK